VAFGGRGAKKGPNAVHTAAATGRGDKIAAAAVAAGSDAGGKGDFKIFPRRKSTQSSNVIHTPFPYESHLRLITYETNEGDCM
jgi:hypothetical protein